MSTMVRTGVTFVLGTMFGSFITRVAVAKRGHHQKAGPNCPRENLGKKTTVLRIRRGRVNREKRERNGEKRERRQRLKMSKMSSM